MAGASSVSWLAWVLVLLLVPVALLNYLDRQMLASMQRSVMEDIPTLKQADQPEERWGFMLGLFKWVYAACSLVGGYVADRFNRRWVIGGSLFVWSGVTWWTGQVTSYHELLWARALMGVSEAFYIPAALALITDWHPGPTRSRAVGLHQIGIYCGVILGGFGGYVADHPYLGWRFAFMFCGVLGMVYAVPLLLLLPRCGAQRSADSPLAAGPSTNPGTVARELLTNVSFLILVLYFTIPAISGWVVRDWMPAILRNQFDLSQGQAGVAATVYWQMAAIVGALLGGWLADRWVQSTLRGRIYISASGMMLLVAAIFGIGQAPTLGVAIACLIGYGIGWGFFDGNNMPILAQIVRPHLRATGYGIMNFVSISVGGLADWVFGLLRDRYVPLAVSFGGLAGLTAVSVVLVLLIRPRTEAVSDQAVLEEVKK
ncbi:MAG: MFS transporter [Gemmataceae bacterium]